MKVLEFIVTLVLFMVIVVVLIGSAFSFAELMATSWKWPIASILLCISILATVILERGKHEHKD
jgi:hypothetical protein